MSYIEEWEILDLLTVLVNKSLVIYEEDENGVGRYRLLQTTRQYAHERLLESGEAADVRDRHLDFFVKWAEEAEPQLMGVEQVMWLKRLETEHDNLRAALKWSIANDAERGLRLAGALWRFWQTRGHFAEGREWLEGVLQRGSGAAAVRAKAFTGAGTMAWLQGDYERAAAFHEEALALYRELGDKRGIAFALNNLGVQALNQGDPDRARAFGEESLTLAREVGDKWLMAVPLLNLGEVARYHGDYARARALYEESLTLSRQLGDKGLIAVLLYNLGSVACSQDDDTLARSHYEESLAIGKEVEDKLRIVLGLAGLARVACAQEQPKRAARLLGAAEALRETLNAPLDPFDLADYDRNVAAIRAASGEEAFAAAWAEGRKMTMEEAVEYALEESISA